MCEKQLVDIKNYFSRNYKVENVKYEITYNYVYYTLFFNNFSLGFNISLEAIKNYNYPYILGLVKKFINNKIINNFVKGGNNYDKNKRTTKSKRTNNKAISKDSTCKREYNTSVRDKYKRY